MKKPGVRPYLWLVAAVSLIVPRRWRAGWRQEWEAELQHREESLRRWRRLDVRGKWDLLARSGGSLRDALWMQPRRLEEDMFQDLRFGARMLFRQPGFAFVAIMTLALGIGATTAIFSVVNGVLLRPLPYKDAERLELVLMQWSATTRGLNLSVADFQALEREYAPVGSVAAFNTGGITLGGGEMPEQIQGSFATAGFFDVLGVAPALGRTFLPGEDRPEGDRVVVISHGFWQRRFGANPNVIGQTLRLNERSYTVVGVMPPEFISPGRVVAEVWPVLQLTTPRRRGPFLLRVIAKRNEGVSEEQSRAALQEIARGVLRQWSASYTNAEATYGAMPLKQALVGNIGTTLLVLLGAVACVLLIASVNVANLLLAKATARRQEIAIRAALGASRFRLVRQMLTESVLLAVLGGAAGALLAVLGVDLLLALSPDNIPRLDQVRVDGNVLGFAALCTLLSCLIFGLIPALYGLSSNLNDPLKGGGRGTREDGGRRRLRSLLVIAEFALALPLLVGAGLMVNSFLRLQQVEPGFAPERLLTMRLALPEQRYPEPSNTLNFYTEILRRVRSLPGVRSASVASNIPLDRGGEQNNFNLARYPTPPGEAEDNAEFTRADPAYFQTMGIPLLTGRFFSEQDTVDTPPVAVVSASFARRYFPGEDPIGMHLKTGGCTDCPWTTIIGVAGDVKHYSLGEEDDPAIYVSALQERLLREMHLTIRTAGDPLSLVPTVRREVNGLDPELALADINTMERLLSASLGQPRYRFTLLSIFAVVALLLAAVGIYGVLAYAVSQRTQEIGIRLALGAQKGDIFRLVIGRGMLLSLVGAGVGLAASLALTRFVSSLLYGVSATDPATYISVALLLLGVALAACLIPARRATRIDPMTALRQD